MSRRSWEQVCGEDKKAKAVRNKVKVKRNMEQWAKKLGSEEEKPKYTRMGQRAVRSASRGKRGGNHPHKLGAETSRCFGFLSFPLSGSFTLGFLF